MKSIIEIGDADECMAMEPLELLETMRGVIADL